MDKKRRKKKKESLQNLRKQLHQFHEKTLIVKILFTLIQVHMNRVLGLSTRGAMIHMCHDNRLPPSTI
jgi:hypothetical protein